MADAEDLKSSGDFSSCGFDSHPGHHSFLLKMNELLARRLVCTFGVPATRVLGAGDLAGRFVDNRIDAIFLDAAFRTVCAFKFLSKHRFLAGYRHSDCTEPMTFLLPPVYRAANSCVSPSSERRVRECCPRALAREPRPLSAVGSAWFGGECLKRQQNPESRATPAENPLQSP